MSSRKNYNSTKPKTSQGSRNQSDHGHLQPVLRRSTEVVPPAGAAANETIGTTIEEPFLLGKYVIPIIDTLPDELIINDDKEIMGFVDRISGNAIQPVAVRSSDGRLLKPKDVWAKRGPGLNKEHVL